MCESMNVCWLPDLSGTRSHTDNCPWATTYPLSLECEEILQRPVVPPPFVGLGREKRYEKRYDIPRDERQIYSVLVGSKRSTAFRPSGFGYFLLYPYMGSYLDFDFLKNIQDAVQDAQEPFIDAL